MRNAHAAPITIDWVTVGDPGNANDPATGGLYGGVNYEYRIGKYEVTIQQYTAFLNAVDPSGTNPYGLWNPGMYKAAYFSPVLNSGSGGYYSFATQSNTAPGNNIGSGANQANYYAGDYTVTQSSSWSPAQNYLTDVGAFSASGSFYGTFDQSGNVFEWNDLDGTASASLGYRGGGWESSGSQSSSSGRFGSGVQFVYYDVGFRLAAVPEPTSLGLAVTGGLAALGWTMVRRRKRVGGLPRPAGARG